MLKLHLPHFALVQKHIDLVSPVVEERVVYTEVAEYYLHARLYSDLCVSENGVVLIIDHSSVDRLIPGLLGMQGVASVVGDRNK